MFNQYSKIEPTKCPISLAENPLGIDASPPRSGQKMNKAINAIMMIRHILPMFQFPQLNTVAGLTE